jgi:hypothetical protein
MIRPLRTVLAALLLSATVALAGAIDDPLGGAQFSDGKEHALADLADQTTVVIFFCGHCPRAGAFMKNQAKAIHDAIQAQKAPARLIALTPDLSPTELIAWAKERGLDDAFVGQDTVNQHEIGLNNIFNGTIWRGGRQVGNLAFGQEAVEQVKAAIAKPDAGSHRYQVDGLSDKGKELWWLVERGRPQALEALMSARKSKAGKDDADKIYAAVEADLGKRQDALVAAEPTLATYEALERLLADAAPIALKPAAERLKALGKEAALKPELKAREIFRQCQELKASANPQKAQSGKDGLAELAKRMPTTVYGQKAAK